MFFEIFRFYDSFNVVSYHQYVTDSINMDMFRYLSNQENRLRAFRIFQDVQIKIYTYSKILMFFEIFGFYDIFKVVPYHQYFTDSINMDMLRYLSNQGNRFSRTSDENIYIFKDLNIFRNCRILRYYQSCVISSIIRRFYKYRYAQISLESGESFAYL